MRNGVIAGIAAVVIALGIGAYVMYSKQNQVTATEQSAPATTTTMQPADQNPGVPAEGRSATDQAPAVDAAPNAPSAAPAGETPADQGAPVQDAPAAGSEQQTNPANPQ
jgi:uncharacterized protein HemX